MGFVQVMWEEKRREERRKRVVRQSMATDEAGG